MTTAAVIDRLVHHATILELNADSYRANQARSNAQQNIKEAPNEKISEIAS